MRIRIQQLLLSLPFVASCGSQIEEPGADPAALRSMAEACDPDPHSTAPSDPAIGRTQQALFASRALNYFWGDADTAAQNNTLPNSRTDFNVCWEPDPIAFVDGTTQAQKDAYMDNHKGFVQRTWSRYARLNTYFWAVCTSGMPGLHVRLCRPGTKWMNADGSEGICPGGGQVGVNLTGIKGAALDGVSNGLRFNTTQVYSSAVFVHEFGHALGFLHEEARHKAAGGTEFDGTYPCSGQDKYQRAQGNQVIPTLSNAATYGGIYWGTNNGTSGFQYQWSSIMAYCNNPPERPAPYINHYDIAAVQRVYGRRQQGTLLSMRAYCTEMSGSQVFLSGFGCDEFANVQEFKPVLSNGDQWNLQNTDANTSVTKCIAPTSATDGAAVTPQTCSTSTDWRLENMFIVGFGGMCLDLENGSLTAGNTINMWTCGMGFGANQVWTRTGAGQIKFGSTNWCAEVDAATNGRLRLQQCNASNSRQIFTFNSTGTGQIHTVSQCLDVSGPNDAQFHPTSGYGASNGPNGGASVNAVNCNTSLNQRWNLSGTLKLGSNANLCLHREADAMSSLLTVRTCAFTELQAWDYYF